MCGIAGYMGWASNLPREAHLGVMNAMAESLTHRGPDALGAWLSAKNDVALVHTRLAILDLTDSANQPMASQSGRYQIVFNGEIYNHLELRAELGVRRSGDKWRTSADTETLIEAIDEWGLDGALKKARGMFAFALWDGVDNKLCLARDRVGEKPLYYGFFDGALYFASELKALKAHSGFQPEICLAALGDYFKFGYIPAPKSIYKGIKKLQPGTYLQISKSSLQDSSVSQTEPVSFWSLESVCEVGKAHSLELSDTESINSLHALLGSAVNEQMIADVGIGAFLSGGIDSSLVTALMQSQSDKKVETFSIGFSEAEYNEANYAKEVANHLGTHHTELYVDVKKAVSIIPDLPEIYDEPFADSSQIPTYLVSELTKQNVTVSLSGDAGDEVFCGYNRYLYTDKIWSYLRHIPPAWRQFLASLITVLPPETYSSLFSGTLSAVGKKAVVANFGDKIYKAAAVLPSKNGTQLYSKLVSIWEEGGSPLKSDSIHSEAEQTIFRGLNIIEQMMAMDTRAYLPDDILVKVDRAAMANSLETRVPFLDKRVVEFAWQLPLHQKLRDGETKWILRQILEKYVPRSLTDRPKMGFGIPLESWLRGPLREWAEDLLSPEKISGQGFLDPEIVSTKWREHISGKRNWQHQLWTVLMFQAWFERQ